MGLSPADGEPRRRRRSRSFCSSLSSSLSTSPATTPAQHLNSIIPFSWEQQPGVPKNPTHQPSSRPASPLPLPPPLRPKTSPSAPTRKRSDPRSTTQLDPFAAAMAECAKDRPTGDGDVEELWRKGAADADAASSALSGRFGLVNLYGSCKAASACPVVDTTVRVPRASAHGLLLNRRSG